MTKPLAALALTLALAALSTSCVSRMGDFTLVTNKNVGNQIDLTQATSMGEFKGHDSKPIIFVFPTGVPNAEDALDRAMALGQGQVMTDAVVHHLYWYIPYLFGEYRITVTGQVWQIPGMALPKKPPPAPPRRQWSDSKGWHGAHQEH